MKQTLSHVISPDEHRLPKPVDLMRYHDQANAARLVDVLRGVVGTGPVVGPNPGTLTLSGTDGWDMYAATMFPHERRGMKTTIEKYAAEMEQGEFWISALTFYYLDGEIYLTDGKQRLLAQGLARSTVEFSFFLHPAGDMDMVGRAYSFAHTCGGR